MTVKVGTTPAGGRLVPTGADKFKCVAVHYQLGVKNIKCSFVPLSVCLFACLLICIFVFLFVGFCRRSLVASWWNKASG